MSEEFHNTVRLPDDRREDLLDALDRAAQSPSARKGAHKRASERFLFRLPSVAVLLEHPGAKEASRYLVSTRNISAGGLSFLHGGFLYNGARCKVVLESLDGARHVLTGAVVNCRHVAGTLHEVGVRFDREIEVARFIEPRPGAQPEPETCAPRNLTGRLLLVEPSETVRRIVRRDLACERLEIVDAPYFGAALDHLRRGAFDVVVCECNVEGVMAEEALSRIRRAGFEGPLVFTTASEIADLPARLRALGAAALLRKPFSQRRLVDTLDAALAPARAPGAGREAVGALDRDGDAVDSMFGEVTRHLAELERCIVRRDLESLRQTCEEMLQTGQRSGVAHLIDAARRALAAIEREPSSGHVLDAARALAAVAQRLPGADAARREPPRGSSTPPRQQ